MSPSLNSPSAGRRQRSAAAGTSEPVVEPAGYTFDLRDTLSATVVRELSFAEFRAALELAGKKSA